MRTPRRAGAAARTVAAIPLLAITVATLGVAACSTGPKPSLAAAVAGDAWIELFDGHSLGSFVVTDYGGQGEVLVRNGRLHLGIGSPLTGVTWTGATPTGDYELELVARREQGNDFFAALTFPVGEQCLTLVLGGWGGSLCGLSSLDGLDAARNPTRRSHAFPNGRDVLVRLLVSATAVDVAVDGAELFTADLRGRQLSLRPEVELSRPLGLCAFATASSIARLRWRPRTGRSEAAAGSAAASAADPVGAPRDE